MLLEEFDKFALGGNAVVKERKKLNDFRLL